MSATKLKCPSCGAPIPAKNINIQKMAAVCEECDAVFLFDDLPDSVQQHNSAKMKHIEQPEQATIIHTPDSLDLKIKWSIKTEWSFNSVPMAVWLAVALLIPIVGLFAGKLAITLLIGALLGALPAYYFLTLLVNSTQVRIENGQLIVRSMPLYYVGYGKKQLNLDEVVRVIAEPTHYYPMMKQDISLMRREDLYYDVVAELADGSRKRLIEFFNYEQSFYIVQEVERYLRGESTDNATLFEYEGTLLDAPLIDGELPIDDNTSKRAAR